jgi:hypothetical protein
VLCGEALGRNRNLTTQFELPITTTDQQRSLQRHSCILCLAPSRQEASCNLIRAQFILSSAMSFPKRAPSRALLSHLCRSPIPAPSPCLRSIASRQIRHESTENKPAGEGRSFKGQLYESTAARLARERVERARFSRDRKEPSGARNIALTFGTLCNITSLSANIQLLTSIICSNHRNSLQRLLPRNLRHPRALKPLHAPSLRNHTPEARCIRLEHGSCMGGLCSDCREGECLD